MSELKPGDDYTPYATSEFPNLGDGIVLQVKNVKLEFGNYRIISFLRKLNGVEYRDIFRISDGPDLWLGCCSKEVPDLELFSLLGMPLTYAEPGDRSHLTKGIDVTKFQDLEDYPIEFLMNVLLEISEVELKNNLDSLFPRGSNE